MAGNSSKNTENVYKKLQDVFEDFKVRSERLGKVYADMQEDFKKINIELDNKNKQLEESLLTQEEIRTYLNSILESMNNGVIGVDMSGKITLFNRAASEITGYKPESVLSRKYNSVFKDKLLSEKNVMNVLNSGRGYSRDEKVIWHKSDSPVHVSFQSAVLKDKKGRKLGAVEIFNDISKIKAMEQEMRRNQTMAALGEMAATVAHEIRNPLGAIGVWAGLLDRDFEKNDPRRNTLSKIIDALAQLNRIVSNLLVYSRPIESRTRKIVLQDILEETVNFIDVEAERLEKQIEIKKIWKNKPEIFVMADPEKMQQIIMNLCLNAIQAMPGGGKLSVLLNSSEKGNNGYVSFTIIDTGVGIKIEYINKIFDPFFTTKEKGTGLGLAIVKKFIEYHSGYVNVESEINRGTKVKVFLPKIAEGK